MNTFISSPSLYVVNVFQHNLNNSKISEFIDFIYPRKLEIQDTTEPSSSASYLECYLCTGNGQLVVRCHVKRNDFIFPIMRNFPFLSRNILSASAYEVYFSPIGQEYPFLQVSEIFLSRPAISA